MQFFGSLFSYFTPTAAQPAAAAPAAQPAAAAAPAASGPEKSVISNLYERVVNIAPDLHVLLKARVEVLKTRRASALEAGDQAKAECVKEKALQCLRITRSLDKLVDGALQPQFQPYLAIALHKFLLDEILLAERIFSKVGRDSPLAGKIHEKVSFFKSLIQTLTGK